MNTVMKLAASVAALALLSACGQSSEPATKADAPAATMAQPTLAVAAESAPTPGKPVALTLTLTGADDKPLRPDAMSVSHGHKVHVMIVDIALEDYTHAHAEPGAAPGQWTVSFTPKHPREYRVWTDFTLAADAEHESQEGHEDMASNDGPGTHAPTPSATLRVGDEAGPTVAAVQSLSANVEGYSFTLSIGGALQADAHVPATLTVADAGGTPVSTLEPLMGAYAHLVGFSADGASMMHGHPEGAEPTDASARGGPALTFELHPTVAGPNRVFVQVKIAGKVITAPFTLVVGG